MAADRSYLALTEEQLDPSRWWFRGVDLGFGAEKADRAIWMWGSPGAHRHYDMLSVLSVECGRVSFVQHGFQRSEVRGKTPEEIADLWFMLPSQDRRSAGRASDTWKYVISQVLRGLRIGLPSDEARQAMFRDSSAAGVLRPGLTVDALGQAVLDPGPELDPVSSNGPRRWATDLAYSFALIRGRHLQSETRPSDAEVDAVHAEMMESGLAQIEPCIHQRALVALSPLSRYEGAVLDFYGEDGPSGEARCKTAQAFPMLAKVMADHHELWRGAERGVDLNVSLSHWLGVAVSTTFLRRMHHWLDGGDIVGDLRLSARCLAALPVAWVPNSAEQGQAMMRVAMAAHSYSRDAGYGRANFNLLKAVGGDWVAYEDRLRALVGALRESEPGSKKPSLFRSMEHQGRRIQDTIRAFGREVFSPLMAYLAERGVIQAEEVPLQKHHVTDCIAKNLIGERGLQAAMEYADRFHDTLERRRNRMPIPSPTRSAIRWPAVFEDFVAPNGLRLTTLTNPLELTEEGAQTADRNGVPGLNHCVGGYAADCLNGVSHIVSVRQDLPDGKYIRLSTVEFRFDQQADRIGTGVRQHQGERDTHPPKAAQEALSAFMQEVRNDRIAINREALIPYKSDPARQARDAVEKECGYNWTLRENIQQAILAWEVMLPRTLRGCSPEELAGVLLGREIQKFELMPEDDAPVLAGPGF